MSAINIMVWQPNIFLAYIFLFGGMFGNALGMNCLKWAGQTTNPFLSITIIGAALFGYAFALLGMFFAMKTLPSGVGFPVALGSLVVIMAVSGIFLHGETITMEKFLWSCGLVICIVGLSKA